MIKSKVITASGGKREAHAIITVDDPTLTFGRQLEEILTQYDEVKTALGSGMRPVFRRWFLSDSANQRALVSDDGECATSIVEQPPLSLTKAALWVWMIEDAEVEKCDDGRFAVKAFGHTHLFEGGVRRPGMDTCQAIYSMLKATDRALQDSGGSLLESCARTWIFVQNVDADYADVVKGRNRAFEELGLTPETRFIASTGIGGRQEDPSVSVAMDSYSVLGLMKGAMRQISAPSHLNPTHEYGVAFERAASICYADRRHLFISGTASIDNKGRIVAPGDIRRQTLRMWENVETLLKAASFGWKDVGHILVYLRDPADCAVVKEMFENRFPDIPYIILLAPVCRPGWLVEMECMAMRGI